MGKGKEIIELPKSRWWIHGAISQVQILILGFEFGAIFDRGSYIGFPSGFTEG